MGVTKQQLWDMVGAYPVCAGCGAQNIVRDAWAEWSIATRDWQLKSIFDQFCCDSCGSESVPDWRLDEEFRKARIRRLNDQCRRGQAELATIVVTNGVEAQGQEFVREVLQVVADFDQFTKDNDPHQEHDFGSIEVCGEKLFFKVDYFDPELKRHSDDAANPAITHRVLTIMLACEY